MFNACKHVRSGAYTKTLALHRTLLVPPYLEETLLRICLLLAHFDICWAWTVEGTSWSMMWCHKRGLRVYGSGNMVGLNLHNSTVTFVRIFPRLRELERQASPGDTCERKTSKQLPTVTTKIFFFKSFVIASIVSREKRTLVPRRDTEMFGLCFRPQNSLLATGIHMELICQHGEWGCCGFGKMEKSWMVGLEMQMPANRLPSVLSTKNFSPSSCVDYRRTLSTPKDRHVITGAGPTHDLMPAERLGNMLRRSSRHVHPNLGRPLEAETDWRM